MAKGANPLRRVAVDPEVPMDVANLFRQRGPLLSRIRAGWSPEPPAATTKVPAGVLQAFAAASGGLLVSLLLVKMGQVVLFVFSLLVFVVFVGLLAARDADPLEGESADHELYGHARWYEGRYLLPEDFDQGAGQLLGRAQRAVDSVLGSRVNAMGMLDDMRNAVMLPAQEWEIARLLAKLSALRSEHRELAYGGSTPEVAAALAPLERALAGSEAAVVARVEALERYAGHVAEAERALNAHEQIEVLRARLPRYEELLAESGADAFAVPELDHLAQDAGRLEQALRDSVRSAHEAFRHLDGPPSG
ncbi:hypothetical protein [Streptosporangium carneum]|uniref:Uncharacterized protein n=1 Tax=Streptosporangium carneum TaxID=47481 RepID=A0A9W6I8Y6_9ACTN|nr:hypothetical protein [Streptosporangium carneum]GLK13388.1 hypothetical protein GCM10017600_67990 [Streptosporangium carneum]